MNEEIKNVELFFFTRETYIYDMIIFSNEMTNKEKIFK